MRTKRRGYQAMKAFFSRVGREHTDDHAELESSVASRPVFGDWEARFGAIESVSMEKTQRDLADALARAFSAGVPVP